MMKAKLTLEFTVNEITFELNDGYMPMQYRMRATIGSQNGRTAESIVFGGRVAPELQGLIQKQLEQLGAEAIACREREYA